MKTGGGKNFSCFFNYFPKAELKNAILFASASTKCRRECAMVHSFYNQPFSNAISHLSFLIDIETNRQKMSRQC